MAIEQVLLDGDIEGRRLQHKGEFLYIVVDGKEYKLNLKMVFNGYADASMGGRKVYIDAKNRMYARINNKRYYIAP